MHSNFGSNLCHTFPVKKEGHILEQDHLHLAELLYNHLCSK